jgi:hypothetical protein
MYFGVFMTSSSESMASSPGIFKPKLQAFPLLAGQAGNPLGSGWMIGDLLRAGRQAFPDCCRRDAAKDHFWTQMPSGKVRMYGHWQTGDICPAHDAWLDLSITGGERID